MGEMSNVLLQISIFLKSSWTKPIEDTFIVVFTWHTWGDRWISPRNRSLHFLCLSSSLEIYWWGTISFRTPRKPAESKLSTFLIIIGMVRRRHRSSTSFSSLSASNTNPSNSSSCYVNRSWIVSTTHPCDDAFTKKYIHRSSRFSSTPQTLHNLLLLASVRPHTSFVCVCVYVLDFTTSGSHYTLFSTSTGAFRLSTSLVVEDFQREQRGDDLAYARDV